MQEINWSTFISQHWGKILGGLIGLLFAILVLNYGFLSSVFIFACMGAGLFIGWRLDLGKGLGNLFNNLFSNRND